MSEFPQPPAPMQPPGPGQPGTYGMAPGQPGMPPAPPTPTPKRNWFARHKVLTGLGVVVVLIVGIAAIGGGGGDTDAEDTALPAATDTADRTDGDDDDAQPAPPEETQPAPAPAVPGIGEPVSDGKFTFVLTQVEIGVMSIGGEYVSTEPQGQFVLVHVTVTNSGNEAQYFLPGSQNAIDTEGRTHSADSAAGLYLDSSTWAAQINPGNSMDGVVVFDIPADATLASIELHDSILSGGVTVALG